MNSVSGCCLKPIEVGRKKWYPIGNQFPIYEKGDYCAGCGREVEEPVLVHSCCGIEICECEAVSA